MAFDQSTRNRLQKFVADSRAVLTDEFTRQMQNDYGLDPRNGTIAGLDELRNLDDTKRETARILRETVEHYASLTPNAETADLLNRIVREQAFTVLNRLAALRMAEARGFLIESLANGFSSKGFQLYSRVAGTGLGDTGDVYRTYLFSLFDEFSLDLKVLFDRFSPFGRLFPREKALLDLLALINHHEIESLWAEDETVGWIYQYFNSKDERKKMRDESAAPRNSRELAVRNQFFTPRYVVEFLTDNTLGRTWYEMTNGATSLVEKCRYLVKTKDEVGKQNAESIQNRKLKDPREILMLDPACGSMHFGLYAFDLFLTIYEEAWEMSEQFAAANVGKSKLKSLRETYENDREKFLRDVPRLIIENNIHGVDIDPRAVQIAGLSLWLRAQRAWSEQNVKPLDRPQIRRSNIVCAEPMPGEADLLEEFITKHFSDTPEKRLLGEFVRRIFDSMRLAGEAGSLLKIEEEAAALIAQSKEIWTKIQAANKELYLFEGARTNVQAGFDFEVGDITNENFWDRAESEIYKALRRYSEASEDGAGYSRRLFADDAAQGFAFIDICRKKYDAVLMNPPFGDASLPSKPYIDDVYGDTKGDVYKAFVECFQDRLVPAGMLGIISSRTGFFLSGSADWRERIVLRLYRPLLLADFGMGVLDAMVETAGYVLRSLTTREDRELTLQLLPELAKIPTDKNDVFSTKKYQDGRGLKRFQATAELNRLQNADFIKYVEGSFPRWSPLRGVIAKAQIPPTSPFPPLVCFRLLGEKDKGAAFDEIFSNVKDERRFVAKPEDFYQIPNTPFCYWASSNVRRLFKDLPTFEGEGRTIKQGLATGEDFRFLRLWCEVNTHNVITGKSETTPEQFRDLSFDGKYWVSYAKGGSYSPFYADIPLLVNWKNDGREIRNFGNRETGYIYSRYRGADFYFVAGLTYPRRLNRVAVSPLPKGSIISVRGSGIFGNQNEINNIAGLFSSYPFDYLVKTLLGRFNYPQFDNGSLSITPTSLAALKNKELGEHAKTCIEIKRILDTTNETSHVFQLPALLQVGAWDNLGKRVEAWQQRVDESEARLQAYQCEIDDIAFRLYGISDEDRRAIEQSTVGSEQSAEEKTDDIEEESESLTVDRKPLTADLLAYALGAAFGRWDLRYATSEKTAPELPDPFAPLPVCPPGMLQNAEGLPASPDDLQTTNYELRISWDGILVDDAGHKEDVENRLRSILELIFKDRAEAIETETCAILGVKSLRDYFRKPAGFFADHLKRYSKSRRQAPIYLPLSNRSGEYTLWLYYHRLTDQTLYTCVNDYVEPKLKSVQAELNILRSKPTRTTEEEKRFEKQQTFAYELDAMQSELLRLAAIWKPNLNDGVQITMSPLWKLFSLAKWQKILKETWQKLEKGDYDWAHLAFSLFPERVRGKCGTDKSLAIAHDLEDLYIEPPPKAGKKKKKAVETENNQMFENS